MVVSLDRIIIVDAPHFSRTRIRYECAGQPPAGGFTAAAMSGALYTRSDACATTPRQFRRPVRPEPAEASADAPGRSAPHTKDSRLRDPTTRPPPCGRPTGRRPPQRRGIRTG